MPVLRPGPGVLGPDGEERATSSRPRTAIGLRMGGWGVWGSAAYSCRRLAIQALEVGPGAVPRSSTHFSAIPSAASSFLAEAAWWTPSVTR